MSLWNQLRFALRQLRKTPTLTAIVLGTLALCIGANTAIYSVLDAVLVRPLPYPDPNRLALVTTEFRQNGAQELDTSQTGAQFEGVRDGARNLEVAAYSLVNGINFATSGHVEYVQQQRVSAGFFHVLGIAPRIGREFTRAEDVAGGPALAILSDSLWRRVLDANPAIVGQAINLRGEPFTIVGVMPPGFRAEQPVDVWTPLRPSRTGEGGGSNYSVIARLKPGVRWIAGSEELQALSPSLAALNLPREMTAEGLGLFLAAVGLYGLMSQTSSQRTKEFGIRLALGCGPRRLMLGVLGSGAGLAAAGSAAGVVLAFGAVRFMRSLLWGVRAVDPPAFAFSAASLLLVALAAALAPAARVLRLDPAQTLRDE